MALGSTQHLVKINTRNISWGKGGRCTRKIEVDWIFCMFEILHSSSVLRVTFLIPYCHLLIKLFVISYDHFLHKYYFDTRYLAVKCMLSTFKQVCGNKTPTRCNRGFYCRSYCLLNMFRATLCPSSGAQEYYTVVAACGFQVAGLVRSWGLCVRFAGCLLVNQQASCKPDTFKIWYFFISLVYV